MVQSDMEVISSLLEEGEGSSTAQNSIERLDLGQVYPPEKEKGSRAERRKRSRGEDQSRYRSGGKKAQKTSEGGGLREEMRDRSPSPAEGKEEESTLSGRGQRGAGVAARRYDDDY